MKKLPAFCENKQCEYCVCPKVVIDIPREKKVIILKKQKSVLIKALLKIEKILLTPHTL